MSNEAVCPTCGSIDLESNKITIDGKVIICPCKEQKDKAMLYGRDRANIPQEYWYLGLEDYKADPEPLKEVQDYIKHFDNYYKNNIGMFLYGTNGIGKTFLAVQIIKEVIKKRYRNVQFTCLSDIISLFTASWYSPAEQKVFYNKMLDSQLLVIDDVGKEYHAKNNLAESVFDRVLRYRKRPIIITSNKSIDNIGTMYGESILSLVYGKLIPVKFFGEDFRKKSISKTLKVLGKHSERIKLIK